MIARPLALAFAALVLALASGASSAQAPVRPPYGPGITLETAKKVAAAGLAEAKKNNWNVAVAIVDNHGMLVYYEMADDTQTSAAWLSIDKARTAATFRRPSKELEDNIIAGRNAVLGLGGATPVEGGVPIMVGGKMVGAIGVSGMAAPQDGVVARAGVDAVK